MPTFREILTAADADLVKHFYRIKPSDERDFIKRINHVAGQLDLNHSQLVCALGFNPHLRDLTDILSVVGFSSYKLLTYRSNELFATDGYRQLPIDNVVDIYAEHLEDSEILATLRELLLPRLTNLERLIEQGGAAALVMAYKLEVHAIYTGGIATPEFVMHRVTSAIGDKRALIDEIQMIVAGDIVPASNLFFSDHLLPAEKRFLIDSGRIERHLIENRLRNTDISEDERQMLEDFA